MIVKKLKCIVFLLLSMVVFGQEIPPILKFQPQDYQSENQNWAITQNQNKFIYVANNKGLLEYNGAEWKLYPSPNNTIIRSLLSVEDRIYSGAYMEFGFWELQNTGLLKYTSLSDKIREKLIEDENIWNIKKFDKWIIFQSFDRLYFYNTKNDELNFLTDIKNYYRIFNVNNAIYIFKSNGNLYQLENGAEKLIAEFPKELEVKILLNIFKRNDELILLTRKHGFFKVRDNKIKKWKIPFSNSINNLQVFCGIELKDNTFLLGTISNGIIHLSSNGEKINQIDQSKGLGNNTVLSLFEDIEGNVWSALDNGINCLNMQSFIKEYNDDKGSFGTTYCSEIHDGKIYLGTNQGLFYKDIDKNEAPKFVEGTKGQVWSLFKFEGDLLCGHTSGTFLIKEDTSTKISQINGAWNFKKIPNLQNQILQGHYSGMSILERSNGIWKLKNKIEGFKNSARFFEFDVESENKIWVNHEYKGVYQLSLSKDFLRFEDVNLLSDIERGKGSGLVKHQNKILYSYKEGVFSLERNQLKKENNLSKLFTNTNYISGKLISDQKNRLWSFNENTISYAENGPIPNEISVKYIPIKNYLRKTTVSFENITNLFDNTYILGKTNGYLLLDLDRKKNFSHTIFLNKIKIKNNDSLQINLNEKGDFRYNQSSLVFNFSTPTFNKYELANYQYKINDNDWQNLNGRHQLILENLGYGNYILSFRSLIGNQFSENVVSYEFRINPPFYLSNYLIFLYVLLTVLAGFFIHKLYKRYYKKQHQKIMNDNLQRLELQKIQADQQVTKLNNEKLSQEIEGKNRELAISTMSIIKRNEFLRSIKKELKNNDQINKDNPVFKLIEKNLNNTKDWNFFKDAFNNADKDFLKRAKQLHPDLTHNNLKFCAYLRLNLTSKEIAPLLNISVKSVEIRRYRLRKKLNLQHETNLTDYILSI